MSKPFLGVGGPLPLTVPGLSQWWSPAGGQGTNVTPVINVMYLLPVWLPAMTIQAVGIDVGTAAAGGTVRVGLYAAAAGGDPAITAGPLADWGTLSAAAAGLIQITGLSTTVPGAGIYYIPIVCQGAVVASELRGHVGSGSVMPVLPSGSAPGTNRSTVMLENLTAVTGALPSTANLQGSNLNPFKVWFKRSAT